MFKRSSRALPSPSTQSVNYHAIWLMASSFPRSPRWLSGITWIKLLMAESISKVLSDMLSPNPTRIRSLLHKNNEVKKWLLICIFDTVESWSVLNVVSPLIMLTCNTSSSYTHQLRPELHGMYSYSSPSRGNPWEYFAPSLQPCTFNHISQWTNI